MFGIFQMVLWLTVSLLDHFDLQTSWIVKIKERYNGFLSLKVNIPSIESVLFSLHAILRDYQQVLLTFFMENTLLKLL